MYSNQSSCIKNINDLEGLSADDIQHVIEAAKEADAKGEQLCVVLEDHYYGNDTETVIYYVGSETDTWVENYLNSGGMWHYDSPKRFL